jgi:single-stranded DNA-binding protein
MNHITILGRLTEGVTVKKVNDFWSVRGRVASNVYRKNSDDVTNFLDFSFARNQEPNTDYIARLTKGAQVLIMGEITSDVNKTESHTYHNVRVNAFRVRSLGSSVSEDTPETNSSGPVAAPVSTDTLPESTEPSDDDIPF